jgi:hypothetical protein
MCTLLADKGKLERLISGGCSVLCEGPHLVSCIESCPVLVDWETDKGLWQVEVQITRSGSGRKLQGGGVAYLKLCEIWCVTQNRVASSGS